MALIKEIRSGSGNWTTIIYTDNTRYDGYTKNRDIREGLGTLYSPENIVLKQGIWENDELIETLEKNEFDKRVNLSFQHSPHW